MKQALSCSLRQQWKCECFPFRSEILLEQIQTCHQSVQFVPGMMMMMVCVCVRAGSESGTSKGERSAVFPGGPQGVAVHTDPSGDRCSEWSHGLPQVGSLFHLCPSFMFSLSHLITTTLCQFGSAAFFQSLLKTFIKMPNSKLHFHYF